MLAGAPFFATTICTCSSGLATTPKVQQHQTLEGRRSGEGFKRGCSSVCGGLGVRVSNDSREGCSGHESCFLSNVLPLKTLQLKVGLTGAPGWRYPLDQGPFYLGNPNRLHS